MIHLKWATGSLLGWKQPVPPAGTSKPQPTAGSSPWSPSAAASPRPSPRCHPPPRSPPATAGRERLERDGTGLASTHSLNFSVLIDGAVLRKPASTASAARRRAGRGSASDSCGPAWWSSWRLRARRGRERVRLGVNVPSPSSAARTLTSSWSVASPPTRPRQRGVDASAPSSAWSGGETAPACTSAISSTCSSVHAARTARLAEEREVRRPRHVRRGHEEHRSDRR